MLHFYVRSSSFLHDLRLLKPFPMLPEFPKRIVTNGKNIFLLSSSCISDFFAFFFISVFELIWPFFYNIDVFFFCSRDVNCATIIRKSSLSSISRSSIFTSFSLFAVKHNCVWLDFSLFQLVDTQKWEKNCNLSWRRRERRRRSDNKDSWHS